jgi:TrmH family RNA methyltransferase
MIRFNVMSIERINSQKHSIIQTLRDVQTEKSRQQLGLFPVEGIMVVRRALDYGTDVRSVVCTDKFVASPESASILSAADRLGVGVYQVSEGLMSKVVPAKPTPLVVAMVERRLHDALSLLEGENPLLVLIDQCENPDNLGMLLRSLDAAGVDGIVLTSDSVDPFNRLCVRASRGSVLSLKLSIVSKPEDWVKQAREKAFRVFSSSAHGAVSFWTESYTGPSIIVVGNEHTGVRQSIRDESDSFVFIPMSGKMESLNIAVAGAILAYEAARQRVINNTQ